MIGFEDYNSHVNLRLGVKIAMTKKTRNIIIFSFIVFGLVLRYMPIRFLLGVEPEEIATIVVLNENNGDEFEITNSYDIGQIIKGIKKITFEKDPFVSEADWYYRLTFIDVTGKEIGPFGIQNNNYMRKGNIFYRCKGELGNVIEYLERLEAKLFPDYNKDPDFPYS